MGFTRRKIAGENPNRVEEDLAHRRQRDRAHDGKGGARGPRLRGEGHFEPPGFRNDASELEAGSHPHRHPHARNHGDGYLPHPEGPVRDAGHPDRPFLLAPGRRAGKVGGAGRGGWLDLQGQRTRRARREGGSPGAEHLVVKWGRIAAVALIGSVSGRAAELKEPPANQRIAVVFVSADLLGYLGPCGCSEAMRGGIDRAAEQIAQARAANPNLLYIDGGDALFGRRELSPVEIPQETLKAKTIAQAFKLSGLATRAVGELDDARGPVFRKSLKLPEQPSGSYRVFDQQGLKVAIVAARG